MGLNLIQFFDGEKAARISGQLFDEKLIIASDAHLIAASSGSDNANVKFYRCNVVSKKDGTAIQKARRENAIFAVAGSSADLCAWAANSKGVDVLLQPFTSEKCNLDMQTANVLRDNNIYVCILFNEFLESDGFRLSQLLKNASMCLKICESAKTKIIFASGARNTAQMRASKDLASFGVMLGMKKEDALRAQRDGLRGFAGRLK